MNPSEPKLTPSQELYKQAEKLDSHITQAFPKVEIEKVSFGGRLWQNFKESIATLGRSLKAGRWISTETHNKEELQIKLSSLREELAKLAHAFTVARDELVKE